MVARVRTEVLIPEPAAVRWFRQNDFRHVRNGLSNFFYEANGKRRRSAGDEPSSGRALILSLKGIVYLKRRCQQLR